MKKGHAHLTPLSPNKEEQDKLMELRSSLVYSLKNHNLAITIGPHACISNIICRLVLHAGSSMGNKQLKILKSKLANGKNFLP
jgi:hypothetical protein